MLDIYARSFLTATRSDTVSLRDVPPKGQTQRRRWFARRKTFDINPKNL